MSEPVADQKRAVFRKIAVIEGQQELTTVGIKTLNGVGDTRREVPKITLFDVIDEVLPLRIDGGDSPPFP